MAYIIPTEELISDPHLQEFFEGVAKLRTAKEVEKVLSDALTDVELQFLIKRWQAIKMIHQGVPYRKIAKELGISTSTITKAAYSYYQERGGWHILLRKLGYLK